MSNISITSQTLRLQDGRVLGYAEYGSPTGLPVFYFHGANSSRLEAQFLAEAASDANIRVISPDRPGIGLSDPQPSRHFLDWPSDVLALAEALHIGQFAVAGTSGGASYAAACAYRIPHRLTSCGLVSGMGPMVLMTKDMPLGFRANWSLVQHVPFIARLGMLPLARIHQNPASTERLLARTAPFLPEPDKKMYLNSAVREVVAGLTVETFRQGISGPVYDLLLLTKPWDFNLNDISFPNIFLWHGELDGNVAVAMGRAVASALPHCQPTYYANEAHLSVLVNHPQEILTALIS